MDKRSKEYRDSLKAQLEVTHVGTRPAEAGVLLETPIIAKELRPSVRLLVGSVLYTEIIADNLKVSDIMREIEANKRNNQFFTINAHYYNLNNVSRIEFINLPEIKNAQPTPPPAEKTIEELQREKQPDADKWRNVYNGNAQGN